MDLLKPPQKRTPRNDVAQIARKIRGLSALPQVIAAASAAVRALRNPQRIVSAPSPAASERFDATPRQNLLREYEDLRERFKRGEPVRVERDAARTAWLAECNRDPNSRVRLSARATETNRVTLEMLDSDALPATTWQYDNDELGQANNARKLSGVDAARRLLGTFDRRYRSVARAARLRARLCGPRVWATSRRGARRKRAQRRSPRTTAGGSDDSGPSSSGDSDEPPEPEGRRKRSPDPDLEPKRSAPEKAPGHGRIPNGFRSASVLLNGEAKPRRALPGAAASLCARPDSPLEKPSGRNRRLFVRGWHSAAARALLSAPRGFGARGAAAERSDTATCARSPRSRQ